MTKTVIQIENLSKLYRLGEVGTGTLSHDLNRWLAKVRGREDPYKQVGQVNNRDQKSEGDYIWALKDINLEVGQGEVLGIIGKNGSGKSTLLKLISKITAPTHGVIRAKGRTASLLEVGTGMHPEMTARENIYLNGSILGMKKQEIQDKFDEIVDFAGCEMFVDTPIKRFSSGMRVRLGFAVAAFLESEILIVDEVLAVGDASFQKKAIGKMKDITEGKARTVLFVSHNMASVSSLCSSVVLLDKGSIQVQGETNVCINEYLKSSKLKDDQLQFINPDPNDLLKSFGMIRAGDHLSSGESLIFQLMINDQFLKEDIHIDIGIYNAMDEKILHLSSRYQQAELPLSTQGKCFCTVNSNPLAENEYYVNIALLSGGHVLKHYSRCISFNVVNGDFFKQERISDSFQAKVFVDQTWSPSL